MNAMTWAMKITGATVAGALLAGVGMTASLAATPAVAASGPAGTYSMAELTNLTPFVMHYQAVDSPSYYDVLPPATLQPGQTASWAAHFNPGGSVYLTFNYLFTDELGNGHQVNYMDWVGSTGDAHHIRVLSEDGQGAGAQESTANFRINLESDGSGRHVDALWTQPAAITIDAKADPSGAAAVVNTQLPRAKASDISWTPASSTPTYSHTAGVQASSTLRNDSSAPATLEVSQETQVGESTSLSEEVTASVSTKVFGFAAKVAASVTSEQEWSSSDSVTIGYKTKIRPGNTGYLVKNTTFGTLTGTLVFKTPEGVQYTLTNVAITRGDLIDPAAKMHTGMNVTSTQAPSPAA
jgi:hypothetical protein